MLLCLYTSCYREAFMYKITHMKIFNSIYFIIVFSVILISGCMQNNNFSRDVYEVIDKIKTGA